MLGILGSFVVFASLNFVSAAFSVGNILNDWAQADVFTYVLPFLLVFALVYGILIKSNVFGDNKGAIVIISLALGLLSLVGDYVPRFFQTIAPNLAIGLSVLLAAIIFLGLFMGGSDTGLNKTITWTLVIIGFIAFLFVIGNSFQDYTSVGGNLWDQYGPALLTLLILIGLISMIIFWGHKKTGP